MAKMTDEVLQIIKKKFDEGTFTLSDEGIIFKKLKSGKLTKYGSRHQRGYINFWISVNGVVYRTFAHRIIYYLHYGIWDDTKIINHLDGNKSNNKIDNLELISQFENILYSINNDEIVFEAYFIDEKTKAKYHLDGEKWEVFKKAAYEGFRRHIYKNYEPNHPFYQACNDFKTVEEYKEHIGDYFVRYEKQQKMKNKKSKGES